MMGKKNIEELTHLINQLNNENELYISKIKDLIQHNKMDASHSLISYFTYTFNISYHLEKEHMIIGTYHITNQGTEPITNPHICIKFSQEHPFQFSGKILSRTAKMPMKVPDAWDRMNNPEDKEEYWLKPSEDIIIQPGEKLSFSNFQLKWKSHLTFTATVNGYAYSDEINEGVASLNQISMITSGKKEDELE
ncbi:hypothetical protein ACFQWC_12440 [Rossellomorea sp. GCM10028870]|uniref:hypothetical protein n=1 Tax=Rossellomorea sp. GCM10028870 TaxID=3273426 RepID=UPI0036180E73